MPLPLKVLMVEDNPADAELALLQLRAAGFEPDWERVDTEAAFLARLDDSLDLVLSDFQMPEFNGFRALELLNQSGLAVPFILVSGTVGEDMAVLAIKNGAADYLMKDRLARLGIAVTHALAEHRLRDERRQVDEAAQRQLAELRVLFDMMPAMIWFKDTENRLLRVNQRVAESAGKAVAEIEGKSCREIYPQEAAGFFADDLEVIRSGAPKLGIVESVRDREVGELWIQTDKVPVFGKAGEVVGIVVMAQDITGRKRLEEQIRQSQKMDAIGTLAGGIAHDFNNILAAINGYTELAQLTLKDNPEVREHLDAVVRAASRATDLVRQILTFSRQQPLARRPIQLLPVVAETFELLRATIPSTIEFDLALASDTPTVFADATQIHQILMNLGTNAWHAMKDRPGRLRVKLEKFVVDAKLAATTKRLQPGVYARVSVRDTGSGMDPVTLRRIFEPFFTTKPLGEGTGLGLAVVHGIIDNHDGAITVDSRPGEGTVFCVYFPAHVGEADVPVDEAGSVPRGRGERVLVVDDEELLAQLGRKTLTALGYEAEAVTQSSAALALVRGDPQRFALVITDETMPGMTGLQLATQLRQIRPGLPVILMTGYAASLTAERVEAAGIRKVLFKPATLHSLATAVRGALVAEPGFDEDEANGSIEDRLAAPVA
jgi:PAS domain S-box-containing protein